MNHRLLLIEPADTAAVMIRAVLEQRGFEVDLLPDPHDVRERDLTRYGVVIIDVHRETRDSLAVVEWLHREQSELTSRIVIITADDAAAVSRELDALGVCGVVAKPISSDLIVAAVEECLEKNPHPAVQ